ncbi:hypothetical protein [Acidovorax sp.]|uniref:hypothetical protein n=1 Tax=Acidovorax sp. TaxID=1872122 RepID=UPI003919F4E2
MFITLKSWAHYLRYVLVNRPKFVVGTSLTMVSLAVTFLTLSDTPLDLWAFIGLAGTLAGALLTMSDIGSLRNEVHDIDISHHYNTALIDSLGNNDHITRIGNRYYLIDEEVNIEIIRGALKKAIDHRSPYRLCADAKELKGITAFSLLSYFRSGKFHSQTAFKSRIPVWNDRKIRLDTSPKELSAVKAIAIRETNYFDYISAGFFCLRKIELKGVTAIIGNELIVGSGHADGKWNIAEISEAQTAHHIGINLILTDKHHRLLYQKKNLSPGKVGNCAPSGSGSLDFSDLNNNSFESTIIAGALREFREETGWDKANTSPEFKSTNFSCRPIGISVDLTRGLITDFFVYAHTNGNIKEFINSSKEKNLHDNFEIGRNSIDFFELKPPGNKSPTEVLDVLLATSDVASSAMLNIALRFLKAAALQDVEIGKQLGVAP